ncbi:4270_t:CDS:2 [Scutellospora calospora]|uniref:4270_t:CDS:1 n=1 Tax=Scutellospora calospora TaxID=85575 RepID=A0ACA9LB31_9GLOM|nr:4270_t:CDS:2 [Scutellospora calospora]
MDKVLCTCVWCLQGSNNHGKLQHLVTSVSSTVRSISLPITLVISLLCNSQEPDDLEYYKTIIEKETFSNNSKYNEEDCKDYNEDCENYNEEHNEEYNEEYNEKYNEEYNEEYNEKYNEKYNKEDNEEGSDEDSEDSNKKGSKDSSEDSN